MPTLRMNYLLHITVECTLLTLSKTCPIYLDDADAVVKSSQVKSSHLYLYSAFNNTNCDKATAQYQNGKIVSIM